MPSNEKDRRPRNNVVAFGLGTPRRHSPNGGELGDSSGSSRAAFSGEPLNMRRCASGGRGVVQPVPSCLIPNRALESAVSEPAEDRVVQGERLTYAQLQQRYLGLQLEVRRLRQELEKKEDQRLTAIKLLKKAKKCHDEERSRQIAAAFPPLFPATAEPLPSTRSSAPGSEIPCPNATDLPSSQKELLPTTVDPQSVQKDQFVDARDPLPNVVDTQPSTRDKLACAEEPLLSARDPPPSARDSLPSARDPLFSARDSLPGARDLQPGTKERGMSIDLLSSMAERPDSPTESLGGSSIYSQLSALNRRGSMPRGPPSSIGLKQLIKSNDRLTAVLDKLASEPIISILEAFVDREQMELPKSMWLMTPHSLATYHARKLPRMFPLAADVLSVGVMNPRTHSSLQ